MERRRRRGIERLPFARRSGASRVPVAARGPRRARRRPVHRGRRRRAHELARQGILVRGGDHGRSRSGWVFAGNHRGRRGRGRGREGRRDREVEDGGGVGVVGAFGFRRGREGRFRWRPRERAGVAPAQAGAVTLWRRERGGAGPRSGRLGRGGRPGAGASGRDPARGVRSRRGDHRGGCAAGAVDQSDRGGGGGKRDGRLGSHRHRSGQRVQRVRHDSGGVRRAEVRGREHPVRAEHARRVRGVPVRVDPRVDRKRFDRKRFDANAIGFGSNRPRFRRGPPAIGPRAAGRYPGSRAPRGPALAPVEAFRRRSGLERYARREGRNSEGNGRPRRGFRDVSVRQAEARVATIGHVHGGGAVKARGRRRRGRRK